MRRWLKVLLWVLGSLAALVVVLVLAAAIVLQTPWFHNKVRERIVYEIEKATGGRVELREFGFSARTLTATVRGLVIHGGEAAQEPPLFRAEEIAVGLKIVSIWKKQIDLQSIRIGRPQVNVIVYPDGHTNVPQPKAAEAAKKKSAIQTVLDLAIKRFQIVDGTVRFSARRFPLNAAGEDLRALIFYEPAPARYRSEIAFRSLDVKTGRGETLPLTVEARLTLLRDRVEIDRVRLASLGSAIDASGTVENFAAPRVHLRYAAQVALKDVAAVTGLGPLESRGRIDLAGRAELGTPSGQALTGRLEASGLVFRERGIYVQNIRLVSAVSYTGGRLEFRNLLLSAAGGTFEGAAEVNQFRDFRVDGAARGFSLGEMSRVPGVLRVEWNGAVSGPVNITGTLVQGQLASFVLRTELVIDAAPGPNPVNGSVALTYDRNLGTLSFGPSNVITRFSRIQFSGVLGRKMDATVQTTNLDDAEPAIAMFTTGPPPAMPVKIEAGGVARFQGSVLGPLKAPTIQGHAFLTHFVWTGRRFDHAEADVVVSRSGVAAQNAILDRLGVHATGMIHVSFLDWRPEPNEPITAAFDARSGSLADVLAAVDERNPLDVTTGPLIGRVNLGGTVGNLELSGRADVTKVVLYGQPIERLTGSARYTADQLEVSGAQLQINGSELQVSGRFEHPRGDWTLGRVRFQASTRGIPLSQLAAVKKSLDGLEGRLEMQMAGELALVASGFRPGAFNGWIGVRDLAAGGQSLGTLLASAATKAGVVEARLEGDLAGAKLTGTSQWTLADNYPVRGHVVFTPLQFSTLLASLRDRRSGAELPFNGIVAGAIDFSGSALDPQSWKATLELPVVEVQPTQAAELNTTQPLVLKNTGPILVDIDSKGARVRQAQFRARDTDLRLTGRVGFGSRSPWDLRVQGGLNLALLRDFDSAILSSGAVALDVSIRGAIERPDVYGRIDLRNASINYGTLPNGIDNANGVIFLYRDRAIVETLTAESGGGKLSIGGFVTFAGPTTFNLQAKANDVRVRYPEGVSSTVNATLSFTGATDRSVLSGDVTVTRVGFNPRSDLGSILASASQPVSVPAHPSGFAQGLRFDVRIATAPQVRFETQLTKDVQADASLRLRGDWTRPILLGRATINSGEVIFFGNRYTINSGQILFVNAAKIEPTLNLDLETRVQGIDVTLHLAGPLNKLNVSYRSDPPLPFADVVALLATGRAPTYGGQIGQQAQFGQSWEQVGASALVSQAIANPITGRLQRFFGVSRLKIDPLVTGLTTSNAAARLTLEQNITSNLTFTYITDLSRAQAQIIRIEWDLSNEWSAVAVREENGLFGIDFLWRKQLK